MPVLAEFIGNIVVALIAFFSRWIAKRFAVGLAVLVATAAAWLAMYGVVRGLLSAASVVVPAPMAQGLELVAPTGFAGMVSAWIGIEIALAGYRWFKDVEGFATKYDQWKL